MPNRDQFTTEIYVNNEQAHDALAQLNSDLERLTNQYKNLNKSSKNYDLREKQLAKQIQATRQAIATAEKGTESYARAMNNLGKRSIDQLIKMQRQLNSEIKKLDPNSPEFKKLSDNYQKVTARIQELRKAQEGIGAQEGLFARLAGGASKYFGAIMVGYSTIKRFTTAFSNAYKTITNFEQANANLSTILGVNKNEMEDLEKAAMKLGGTTRYTATEVTNLQTELAKLGFTQKEIIDMAPATLNFATSVGTDLASAAQLAGVALRSFNLASDQTEDVLGTMAVACNKSALSFTYLQNAFSTIAPVAKTYGLSLKDTIALLGTLANAGFDASSAATATRNILLNLSDTNGKLATALGGTVNSFDAILDAMISLRNQGIDLNGTLELTDKRSVAAFNTFLSGAESARELRDALQDVNGELDRIATERMNTVEGAIQSMQSAWERFILSFKGSTGTVSKVLNDITDAIRGVTALINPEDAVGADMERMMAENIRDMYMKTLDPDAFQQYIDDQLAEYDKKIIEARNRLTREKTMDIISLGMRRITGQSNRNEAKGQLTLLEGQRDVFARLAGSATQDLSLNFEQQLKQLENVYNREMASIDASDVQAREARKAQYEADRKAIIKAKSEEMKAVKTAEEEASTEKHELTEKELAELKKAYQRKKSQLDAWHNYQEKQLKAQLLKGEISEDDYNSKMLSEKTDYYAKALALAKKYGEDETAITNKMMDDYIRRLEDEKKKLKEITDQLEKVNAARRKRARDKEEAVMTAEGKSREQNQKALEDNLEEAKRLINEDNWRAEYDFEKWKLDQLHDLGMLSEENHQRALLSLRLQYAQKAAEKINTITEQASNFSSALKEAETAHLEAEYQKQLTAAGNNAEKREQIDAEYEQKKLDLSKKYADVDMGINIAKTVANGAAAVIKALEELGPIAGPVSAVLIGATTAAEIATIVAQRNAIKNTTLNGSSSATSTNTGTRLVSGFKHGGYTPSSASDNQVVGVAHANEWYAPAWMVRQNPVMFANLERYRQEGSGGRSLTKHGFATGGYTGPGHQPASSSTADIETIVENAIRKAMASGAIRAFLVRNDLTELDNQTARLNAQTSR